MPITSEPKGAKPFLPGLVRIRLHHQGTVSTRVYTAINNLYIRFSDNVNHAVADLASVATQVRTDWGLYLKAYIDVDWSLVLTEAQSLGGDGLEAQDTTVVAGTQGGAPLPPQSAVVLSWKSGATWRGGRPRTYLVGVGNVFTSAVGDAQLNPANSAALHASAETFRANTSAAVVGGANTILGFPSYYSKGAIRPVPLFFPFTSLVVHNRLGSQRRRSGKESSYSTS